MDQKTFNEAQADAGWQRRLAQLMAGRLGNVSAAATTMSQPATATEPLRASGTRRTFQARTERAFAARASKGRRAFAATPGIAAATKPAATGSQQPTGHTSLKAQLAARFERGLRRKRAKR